MKPATNYLSGLLEQKYWKIKITFLFFTLIMIFSTPYFNHLPKTLYESSWQTVMKQAHSDTMYQPEADPITHDAKKTFRLTVPYIAKFLHLNEWGIYILQFLIGILFIYLMVVYIQREFNDRFVTFYFVLAATSVYFGTACFTDVYSYFSGWAYFFLFLSIFFNNPLLIFLTSTLAAWTDERGLLALAYVVVFWQFRKSWSKENNIKSLFRISHQTIAVVTAIAGYACIRLYLEHSGYYTPMPGYRIKKYLLLNIDLLQISLWTIFEGFWILILYKFYLLLREKNYFLFVIIFVIDLVMILGSITQGDVTRSISFMILEVFISAMIIYRLRGGKILKTLTMWSAIVCVLFPPYYIITMYQEPIILQRSIIYLGFKKILIYFIGS